MLINGDEQTMSLYPITSDKENDLQILYNAKEIQQYTSMMYADCFLAMSANDITVDEVSSRIIVSPQNGIIDGLSFCIHESSILQIDVGLLPRIDLIVLEKNQETATVEIKVKRGTPSSEPTIPTYASGGLITGENAGNYRAFGLDKPNATDDTLAFVGTGERILTPHENTLWEMFRNQQAINQNQYAYAYDNDNSSMNNHTENNYSISVNMSASKSTPKQVAKAVMKAIAGKS